MPSRKVVSIAAGEHRARAIERRDQLVVEHLAPAEGIARGVARSLPGCFDLEDLVATANLALLRAATRYRPRAHGGTPFPAYARYVIRGAVIESVRRKKYTANTMQGIEYIREGVREDSAALNRAATQPNVLWMIDQAREVRRLREAASWLPPLQQRVLARFYTRGEPTLIDVARELGITHSQAKVAHIRGINAMRARLLKLAI